jgi:hypothetical protein
MSPGLGDDERFGLFHAPFAPNCSSPDHSWKANGARAMQAARCGDRAGISGSFCECFATGRPHMRRWNLRTCDPGAAALFCRETARYYHRRFSATYSLRTPTVSK